jgi:hypothetical protein
MAYVPTRFVGPIFLATLPTAPLITFSQSGIIKNITVSNILDGPLTYNLWLANSSQDAQDYNRLLPDQISQGKSFSSSELTLVVNSGDKLYVTGSIPNGLVFTASGVYF